MNLYGSFNYNSGYLEDDLEFSKTYKLYACPICNNVTLLHIYTDESMINWSYNGEREQYNEEKILFPITSLESNAMPKEVKEAFEAALKIRNIDNNLCLMALRRTLELILLNKGATKWGLKEKIEEIAAKGILPDALKEASKFTKFLGDSAAHGNGSETSLNDVNTMIEFVEYIIEYLYILPHKIERYKTKI